MMQPDALATQVSCCILTYNEEHRISHALRHALKWADDVVVVDKGSTDRTREIAAQAGARVELVAFSPQGHESHEDVIGFAKHDWIFSFTPGEIPTRQLIRQTRTLLDRQADSIDGVLLPIYYFSFGHHDETGRSPWAADFQPRVFHRRRARIRKVVHAHVVLQRPARIEFAPECFVLHQTHATATGFLASHAAYAEAECLDNPPDEKFRHALQMLDRFSLSHLTNDDRDALKMQALGWTAYWSQIALRCAETLANRNVPEEYRERADRLLAQQWEFPSASCSGHGGTNGPEA